MFIGLLLFYFKHLYSIYYFCFSRFHRVVSFLQDERFRFVSIIFGKKCNDIIFSMEMYIYIIV
jgi:hypothetical protein